MCGILAILRQNILNDQAIKTLIELIERRGPDYSSPLLQHDTECGSILTLKASILHLRGLELEKQPVIDESKNALLFNGQIYRYNTEELPLDLSDTKFLFDILTACTTKHQIAQVISKIDGPFALIFWHHKLNYLIYCRDVFGRKSLCLMEDKDSSSPLVLSSIVNPIESKSFTWTEVDCKCIHIIEFQKDQTFKRSSFQWNFDSIYPKTIKCNEQDDNQEAEINSIDIKLLKPLNNDATKCDDFSLEEREVSMKNLGNRLRDAVSKRIRYNRTICLSCRRKKAASPVENNTKTKCEHSKVSVAFSGGIDSVMIALALDDVLSKTETIDLINVAFKSSSPDRNSANQAYIELAKLRAHRNWRLVLCDVAIEELQAKRNNRIRDLILPCNTVIDDSLGCACWFISRAKGRSIDSDWFNENPQFDLSKFLEFDTDPISSANVPGIRLDYESPSSIIFVGSAIDEQLGGYSSHRVSWTKSGYQGLFEEISFLMRRISTRNLGRDDRNYSDHGRDIKLPYLDFDFVSFLNQLPIGLKMNLDEPMGVGPKKLLRDLANAWGLDESSKRVKRAMQFGSRIANLENNKEKGNEQCSRLNVD